MKANGYRVLAMGITFIALACWFIVGTSKDFDPVAWLQQPLTNLKIWHLLIFWFVAWLIGPLTWSEINKS